MNDQGFQSSKGSKEQQQSNSSSQSLDQSVPSKPEYRADAAPKPLEQRERKWQDLKKLRKKNAEGIPQYDVTIVSARYDNERHKWMYTLNDWQNVLIAGETEEKDLV